tara:strand:- start:212988 stop:213191 length:204 start_codon:yes stop_codon:yes gene_type:complete
MNSNIIEGQWDQIKGKAQKKWGKLTDDTLSVVKGNRKILSGKIQESYGLTQDEADKQIREWEDSITG